MAYSHVVGKWKVKTNQYESGKDDIQLPIRVFDSLDEALSVIISEEENCSMFETWTEETNDEVTDEVIGYYLYFQNAFSKPSLERQYYFDPIQEDRVSESLAQSLKEMQQIRKGEMKAESWDDFMKELESEEE